jgi:hypothetical protein
MSEALIVSRRRNAIIGMGLGVLSLMGIGYYYLFVREPAPTTEELVNVIVEPVKVPDEFARTLPADVKGLILVSQGKAGEPSIIRAINPDGSPINLCGSGPEKECKLATTVRALMSIVSSNVNSCSVCPDSSGVRRDCHKDGVHQNKWRCHGNLAHFNCFRPCV